jgi:hypothetical protein
MECEVFEIDSSKLRDVYVFSVVRIIRQLQIRPSELVDWLDPDEYLCLHRIPAEAMVRVRGTAEIKDGESSFPAVPVPLPTAFQYFVAFIFF